VRVTTTQQALRNAPDGIMAVRICTPANPAIRAFPTDAARRPRSVSAPSI
jgi:hypothetical protein